MAAGFERAGYEVVPFGHPCEVCIVHGCTITRTAELKSLRYARSARGQDASPLVVLAGCVVEAASEEVRSAFGADLIVGQDGKFRLPEIIDSHLPRINLREGDGDGEDVVATPLCGVNPRDDDQCASEQKASIPSRRTRALVKVQDGCDFRCAYCIVPAARGSPISLPAEQILLQVRGLAASGCNEIVLTGANLGCYADGETRLIDLLTAIELVSGIRRVRLSSIELSTVERQIIDFMTQSDKLCHYLHVPLQTGDNGLLAAMGRRYTVEDYRKFIDYASARIPLLGLGTDVLVGLPGESKGAFENTLALVRDLPFSNLHVFPYSKRAGTRAAAMPGHISSAEKRRRAAFLLELAPLKKQAFAEACLEHPVAALIEKVEPDGSGTGWTGEYMEARVTRTDIAPNTIVTFEPARYDGRFLTE